jgi:hypothetical protein
MRPKSAQSDRARFGKNSSIEKLRRTPTFFIIIIENLLSYGNCQLDPLWGVILKLNLAIAKEVATVQQSSDQPENASYNEINGNDITQ